MKIRKINILMAATLVGMMAVTGCRKDDGAIPERVTIISVPTMSTNVDATGSTSILFANQGAFAGKFKVWVYFPGATPPTKVDMMVRKYSGTVANNNNVKLFRANISTFPTDLTVSAAEIIALFGPLTVGDTYDFGPDIYVGSEKYEAYPSIGIGNGAGLNGQPGFSVEARYRVQ